VQEGSCVLRRIVLGLLLAFSATLAAAAIGLALAHRGIRRETPPLPSLTAVERDTAIGSDLPIRLAYVLTASQPMPRRQVLDASRDPDPSAPYVMSHPSFTIEWGDGRILLVDVGMAPAEALDFGRPIELLGGGPMQPGTPVREALGERLPRVAGVILTHLHLDHVGAIGELCAGRSTPLRVFQTEAQAERPNFTTRGGLSRLEEAPCVERERLSGGPLFPVPGFPGVFVVASAGHTPGSQVVLVFLAATDGIRRFAITGDTVNHHDGIRHDVAKPFLYRLLVVPENEPRQREVRRFLRSLSQELGFTLLVNHDQLDLEATGIPKL
jgi:glyoxylase-like metal-dependent hydrolase (beta-lactamase superfamily II)